MCVGYVLCLIDCNIYVRILHLRIFQSSPSNLISDKVKHNNNMDKCINNLIPRTVSLMHVSKSYNPKNDYFLQFVTFNSLNPLFSGV